MVVVNAKEEVVEREVVKELSVISIRLDDVSSTFSEKQERDFYALRGAVVTSAQSSPNSGVPRITTYLLACT